MYQSPRNYEAKLAALYIYHSMLTALKEMEQNNVLVFKDYQFVLNKKAGYPHIRILDSNQKNCWGDDLQEIGQLTADTKIIHLKLVDMEQDISFNINEKIIDEGHFTSIFNVIHHLLND